MKIRLTLVCTLLLLAAASSFALPLCQDCDATNRCAPIPGSIEACYDGPTYCYTEPDRCSPPRAVTVLTEWQVASIEINRPTIDAAAVTADTESAAEVRVSEVVEQK